MGTHILRHGRSLITELSRLLGTIVYVKHDFRFKILIKVTTREYTFYEKKRLRLNK